MQARNEMGGPSTQKKPGGTGGGDAALLADLQLGKVEEVYTLDRTLTQPSGQVQHRRKYALSVRRAFQWAVLGNRKMWLP